MLLSKQDSQNYSKNKIIKIEEDLKSIIVNQYKDMRKLIFLIGIILFFYILKFYVLFINYLDQTKKKYRRLSFNCLMKYMKKVIKDLIMNLV